MRDEPVGTVYLMDGGEPLDIPERPAFEILPNGWITVVRNGTTFHYPPTSVDRVEIASGVDRVEAASQ